MLLSLEGDREARQQQAENTLALLCLNKPVQGQRFVVNIIVLRRVMQANIPEQHLGKNSEIFQ